MEKGRGLKKQSKASADATAASLSSIRDEAMARSAFAMCCRVLGCVQRIGFLSFGHVHSHEVCHE